MSRVTTTDETTRANRSWYSCAGWRARGKTTYAQRLEAEGYVRLSIDEEVWNQFGRHGIDYDPGQYREHSAVAESALRETPRVVDPPGARRRGRLQLLAAGSAGALHTADEDVGGRWRLLYLKVDPAPLGQRLDERSRRFDVNAAFPITKNLLTSYLTDFEEPNGEGEEVLTSPLLLTARPWGSDLRYS